MSAVQSLITRVRDMLAADATLKAGFTEFTTREFPFCDDFPAIHVNAEGSSDDTSYGGMGTRQRTVAMRVFVTITSADSQAREAALWPLVDRVRAIIDADRHLGSTLRVAITHLDVRSVPSPVGSYYVGTRRVDFDAVIEEPLEAS